MRYTLLLAGLLTLVMTAAGSSTSHREPANALNHVTVENLRRVPEGWEEIGAPEPSRKLRFRLAVRHDRSLFERTLMEISTPSHPRYGQHLKRHELKALVRPRAEATNAVRSWLEQSGVASEDIEHDGEWIKFVAPVSVAERLMDTTFKTYQNIARDNVRQTRALRYSVPKDIRDHIDMIQPTTRFGELKPHISLVHDKEIISDSVIGIAGEGSLDYTCNEMITPRCLRELYKFDNFTANPNVSTVIGVNGFLEQYARFKDYAEFLRVYSPEARGSNFTWTSVNGGILDQRATNSSVEANLDIQYTAGLVSPAIKVNYYSSPGRGPLVPDLDQPDPLYDNNNEPWLDFFTWLVGRPDGALPQVLTTSYGENEQSLPVEYVKKVCDLIGQLGTRGVSVIFSSGDSGPGSACQTNDGKNTTRFNPIFPASCPYVTSVGGTQKVDPEEAVSFSSGGFSDVFSRPAYQEAAVSSYLNKLGDQWKGLYNAQGRGFPDVAAQGARFRVVDKMAEIQIGGTSASAPVFASIIALLNNKRVSNGKPVLGFLNPWIYSQGYKGLNDIVKGGSKGCTGRSVFSGLKTPLVPGASWNATEGWDPVTGYGTPNFEKLLVISMNGSYAAERPYY